MRFIIFGLLFLSAIYISESKTIAKRDASADLLKSITELITKARAAVETLQKEGKPALINGLEKSIKFLQEMEISLMKLNPTTDLGKALQEGLQKLAKQAEATLEADLMKAKSGFYADASADLLKSITELLTKARAAVETLQKEGKPALINGLEKSIKFLQEMEMSLMKLNPTTDLGKALQEGLQKLAKQAEAILDADLKKAKGSFYADDAAKAELIKQAETLKKSAGDLIAKLTGQGKTVLAEGIKKLENFIIQSEKTLMNLDPKTEIGKSLLKGAEAELKKIEIKLEEEVKKLSGAY